MSVYILILILCFIIVIIGAIGCFNEDREKRNNEFYYENKRLHDTYGYEFDPTNLKKSFQERDAIYRYEQIKKDEEIIKKLKKEDTN